MFLLQGKDPAKPNPAIAAALQAFLTDKDPVMRFTASKALIKWATPETVPALIKALNDESVIVRINAMTALGRLKADAAAEPIARKLASTQDRFQASQALQDMGPAAEPAILKMIGDKDWAVRSEVCKILKVVGTQKSVPALEGLRDDPNPLVKVMAQQALEAITARK
ncbi:MAG: HEAT repeat domain-containing protein, partial [Planctomycetes bacterium]|nr:HEAT repeat domain-containing protein [Planctomycetota bacterium]